MKRPRARRAIAPIAAVAAVPAAAFAQQAAAPATSALSAVPARAQLTALVTGPPAAQQPAALTAVRAHPGQTYPLIRVRAGDTMSGIAAARCGSAEDWTGIYAASRALHLTGPDANLIETGQHLALSCRWVPSVSGRAGAAVVARHYTVARGGDQWDGQHHACGDGDGDGYDMPCSYLHGSSTSVTSENTGGSSYHRSSAAYNAAGSVQHSYPVSGGVNWNAVAACESGGNWSISTGNGFYGGLQFTQQTWDGYGGQQYASSANRATPAQQIAVANRVLAGQGIGAWPVCGRRG